MLPQATLETLREYWKMYRPKEWLFESPKQSGAFRTRALQDAFKTALKRSKIKKPGSLHTLRHSAAGYLKHLKFDLKDIQMLLWHGDISTTGNLYLHFNMEAKNAIADNLNEQFQNFGS